MGQAQAKAAGGIPALFQCWFGFSLHLHFLRVILLAVKSSKSHLLSAHCTEKVLGACLVLRELKMEFAVSIYISCSKLESTFN